jgi:tetratricopeptide (TPR) repeat protein
MTRKAAELNPSYDAAVSNLGWGAWMKGRPEEGYAWLKKGLALSPTVAYGSFGMGILYLSVDNFVRAKDWFDKCVSMQQNLPSGYIGLGLMHLAKNEPAQAIDAVRKIFSSDPNNYDALAITGNGYLVLKDYARARDYYERALRIDSLGFSWFVGKRVITQLAYIFSQTSKQAKAKLFLERSRLLDEREIQIGSEIPGLRYDLACVAAQRGKMDEAFKWLEEAIKLGWIDVHWMEIDPLLISVRGEKRFQEIIANLRQRIETMRLHIEQMERPT